MSKGTEGPRRGRVGRRVEEFLGRHARRRFGPGFEDRVMRRIAAEDSSLEELLARLFPRVAAVAASLLVLLAGYSLITADPGRSIAEAVLGVEPVSLEAAYGLDDGLLDELLEEGRG